MARQQKKPRDPNRKLNKCNICGLPGTVTFPDKDDDGRDFTNSHEVPCLGHTGVHGALWNKHEDYTKYQKFSTRQQAQSREGNVS